MPNDRQSRGLGTLLRHLIDLLDGDVAAAYAAAGLADYRPRFTPVVRALDAQDPSSIGAIAQYAGISHSAASQTVGEMTRRGLVERCKGRDGRSASRIGSPHCCRSCGATGRPQIAPKLR